MSRKFIVIDKQRFINNIFQVNVSDADSCELPVNILAQSVSELLYGNVVNCQIQMPGACSLRTKRTQEYGKLLIGRENMDMIREKLSSFQVTRNLGSILKLFLIHLL